MLRGKCFLEEVQQTGKLLENFTTQSWCKKVFIFCQRTQFKRLCLTVISGTFSPGAPPRPGPPFQVEAPLLRSEESLLRAVPSYPRAPLMKMSQPGVQLRTILQANMAQAPRGAGFGRTCLTLQPSELPAITPLQHLLQRPQQTARHHRHQGGDTTCLPGQDGALGKAAARAHPAPIGWHTPGVQTLWSY